MQNVHMHLRCIRCLQSKCFYNIRCDICNKLYLNSIKSILCRTCKCITEIIFYVSGDLFEKAELEKI